MNEIKSKLDEIIQVFRYLKTNTAIGYRFAKWKETTQTNNDTNRFDTIQPKGGTITRNINPVKGTRRIKP